MMAMDHGAVEISFATSAARTPTFLLTPDFRILIGGPGAAEVKVRLGQHGDTCVDNAGVNAPYVLVTSVFDGGNYRVQPGQRVMFEHGSLHEVVDNEKEPCGCPPAAIRARMSSRWRRAPALRLCPSLLPYRLPAKPMPAARRHSQSRPGLQEPSTGRNSGGRRGSDSAGNSTGKAARGQEKRRIFLESWPQAAPVLRIGMNGAACYISLARSMARITACALLSDSWCSDSGTESATMPAPAWT